MKTKSIIFNLAVLVALALAGVWTVPAQAAVGQVWVCPSGVCGHPGASFSTIQAGINAVDINGTVWVLPGTYIEQINITKSLTLSGAGMSSTHIVSPTPTSMTIYDAFGSQSPNSRYIVHRGTNIPVVRIAASNVVFKGFHVNLNNYVFWDVLGSYTDTTYSRGVGILVDHVESTLGTPDVFTGIAIQNNKVDGMLSGDKGDGIKVLGSATATVTGNYLYGGESGINVQAVDAPVRGQYYPTVTVNSNIITSSDPTGNPFGIGFWSCATGSADGNTIYNDPVNGYALNVWGSRPVSFTNNTVTNVGKIIGGQGAQLYESTNIIFNNNKIEYQALAGAIWSNPTATITGNTIINSTDGFVVDGQTSGSVTMHSNSFTGITAGHYAVLVGGVKDENSGTFWGIWGGPSTITVDATGNWWGEVSGPTHSSNPGGTGGAVSDNVTFSPYAQALVASTTLSTHEVGETGSLDTNLTVNGLYGVQFVVDYNSVLSWNSGAVFNSGTAPNDWDWTKVLYGKNFANGFPASGQTELAATLDGSKHPDAANLVNGKLATWTYNCASVGTSALTYDTVAGTGTYLSDKNGFVIPAAMIGDSITCVEATASVHGTIQLQGRLGTDTAPEGWGSAYVTLTCTGGACIGYGPYMWATDDTGHYELIKSGAGTGIALGEYSASVVRRGYLGATETGINIVADSNTMTTPTLLGGDADDSGTIDLSDLTSVAGRFGLAPTGGADTGPDINGDGIVNIFDLVLVGGNYGLTSSTW